MFPTSSVNVAADIDYAPFSYRSNGSPAGFDIELCDMIAERMGVEVSYKLRPWGEVHDLARAGEVDVVLGLVYTPERDRYLDFTSPYNTFRFAILTHQDSQIEEVEDLEGRRLAYLENDAVAEQLMQDRSIAAVYVTFPTLSAAVRAVGSEETDAVITPYEWARNAENAELTRNLHMVTNEALVSTYRMGVTKARPGLVAELEEVLQQVVQTPEYEALREKWFSQYDSPRATESTSGTGPDRNLIPLIVAVIVAGIVLFVLTDRRANRL